MHTSEDIPYAYYDISNNSNDLVTNIPISIEVIPYKAIPINEIQVNRNNQIYSRGNSWQNIYKYITYTILSLPIILVIIGFINN
jgi:hypothetical protein